MLTSGGEGGIVYFVAGQKGSSQSEKIGKRKEKSFKKLLTKAESCDILSKLPLMKTARHLDK